MKCSKSCMMAGEKDGLFLDHIQNSGHSMRFVHFLSTRVRDEYRVGVCEECGDFKQVDFWGYCPECERVKV